MKKQSILLFILMLSSSISHAQKPNTDFAHTFSIVARDTATGEMAVGVQSHWFDVGNSVSWGQSGVGVVATQSFVNPAYGPNGLQLMENGTSASAALKQLLAKDEGRDFRQVAFLGKSGAAAAYTGSKCVQKANQITNDNFSVQANMMLNDKVVPAMAQAFKDNAALPLAERVVEVLKAAQAAGGDIRGKQSAALIVVGSHKMENSWEDKKINLQVADHENPLQELERLLKTARAYEFMNKGDLAVEEGNMNKALKMYATAEDMFPNNLEMKFWKAVALANNNQMQEAKPIFLEIFEQDENWKTLLKRLPKSGLLNFSKKELQQMFD